MLLPKDYEIVPMLERLIVAGWYREAARLTETGLEERRLSPLDYQKVRAMIEDLQRVMPERDFPGHEVFGVEEGMIVSSLQFRPLEDYRLMQAAFSQAVNWIEIETSSQCNRKCHYCPNSQIDRRSTNSFMDPAVFTRFVRNLQEIDYAGTIALVGQNEFFMHEQNFEYLAHIRQSLPKCSIRLFSNGDYLDRERLDRVVTSGVSEMFVTLHGAPGARYNAEYVMDRIGIFQRRTGLDLKLDAYEKGERLYFNSDVGPMRLVVGSLNFDKMGHNWAGHLDFKESAPRATPCSYPLRQFVVNYAGDMFICCVVPRDNNAANREMGTVTGNLADYPSLFHAYAGDVMRGWRKATFSNASLPRPCDTCTGHEGINEARFSDLAAYVAEHNVAQAEPGKAAA